MSSGKLIPGLSTAPESAIASCPSSVTRKVPPRVKARPPSGVTTSMKPSPDTVTSYTESVWWAFSQIYKKGLIYKGFKCMPYCPRCATPLVLRPEGGRARPMCPAEGCGFVHYGESSIGTGAVVMRGDEVLITNQNYGRMINSWQQRERREGIVLKQISFKVPPPSDEYIVEQFRKAITPRTKVIEVTHITNLTGQIMPVRDIVRMARPLGIEVFVDEGGGI